MLCIVSSHVTQDPLPLRRAKITQEAALRKVQKQKIAVGVAKEAALVRAGRGECDVYACHTN
jgi:hypothetical protein